MPGVEVTAPMCSLTSCAAERRTPGASTRGPAYGTEPGRPLGGAAPARRARPSRGSSAATGSVCRV